MGFHLFKMHLVHFMGFIFYYECFPGLMLIELYLEEGEGDFADGSRITGRSLIFFPPLTSFQLNTCSFSPGGL